MNKELMITLWNRCNNKCTFCYNQDFYHFPIDINKHLDNCIALLKSDKIKEFNCIRLIGGELFDNVIDRLNVRKQFNKILDTLQSLLETKQIQTVNIVTNLLYTDRKDLCYTLDFFKDNITLSTSYDLVGRFKSEIEEERWWNNIQFLQKEYPNLLVDVGINITQPLITQINKEWLDNFQAKLNKYTINFNELFTGIANKDKQTCGFSTLFPKRADFLVFIQNLIDWGYLDTIKDNKNIPLIHYVFDSQTGEAKMIDTNNIQEDGYIDSNIKMRKDIEEMLNIKTGDYITIFDSSNHIFLLSGKITHATENPKGYSIGGLIFFNPNSNKFLINKVGFVDTVININEIEKGNYKIIQHNNIDNTFEYDFFMWNDIEPEVQETCELLNQLGFVKTYSSCCGHGKIPAYIDFNILNLESFFSFVNIMNKYGLCSYCAKHGELEEGYKFRLVIGVEGEKTCHLELVDINSTFDKFNAFLKKYLKINGKF